MENKSMAKQSRSTKNKNKENVKMEGKPFN